MCISCLLDYSYAAVWGMSFQVVAAMFEKLGNLFYNSYLTYTSSTLPGNGSSSGLTASRAEPQLQHPGKHPDTGRALFMCWFVQVSWSNERPLENKELNAIIGAWFTLWRD
ncbi:hypothetical protein Tco_0724009 [Tanacetum coccineum]